MPKECWLLHVWLWQKPMGYLHCRCSFNVAGSTLVNVAGSTLVNVAGSTLINVAGSRDSGVHAISSVVYGVGVWSGAR